MAPHIPTSSLPMATASLATTTLVTAVFATTPAAAVPSASVDGGPPPPAGAPRRWRLRRRRPDVAPLRRAAAFAEASPAALAALVPRADVLRLPRGLPLVEAGATARELVVLLDGEATRLEADGSRTTLAPGAELGGHEALAGTRHPATVVAATTVEVLVVAAPVLRWAAAEGALHLTTPASAPPAHPTSPTPAPTPAPAVEPLVPTA